MRPRSSPERSALPAPRLLVGAALGLTLMAATLPSCELLIGVDDRPEYAGGGGSTSSGGGSTSSGGGTGGTSSGGGSGGTGGVECPAAPPGCGPDPAPVQKWPDSTKRCYGLETGDCEIPGEDGAIVGEQNYTVTAETITDTVTEMEWLKAAVDYQYWEQADAHCKLDHFGKDDWRLPTLMELLTLIDYGRVPLINSEFDLGIPRSHWTAEEGPDDGYHYLLLFDDVQTIWDFIGGELTWGGGGLVSTHARCVRGTQITGGLTTVTDCAPHLVRDSRTGLEWQPVPTDEQLPWIEALAHCAGLCDNGGAWRLASAKELGTLYVAGKAPAIIQPFAAPSGGGMAEFWTSTPSPTTPGKAFLVDFAPTQAEDYSIRRDDVGAAHRAWCVRSYTVD